MKHIQFISNHPDNAKINKKTRFHIIKREITLLHQSGIVG